MPELLDASVCQPRFFEIRRRCHIRTKYAPSNCATAERLNEMT